MWPDICMSKKFLGDIDAHDLRPTLLRFMCYWGEKKSYVPLVFYIIYSLISIMGLKIAFKIHVAVSLYVLV